MQYIAGISGSSVRRAQSGARKAFTLIELLIVVAIIAILAAIAVPNFLEAQVRAKVSRCKADLRTIRTAMEAYRVDYNQYIPDNFPGQVYDCQSYQRLTTPVAYITSVPESPFLELLRNPGGMRVFGYWYGPAAGVLDDGAVETGILFRITSVGPDNLSDYGFGGAFSNWPLEIQNNTPLYINGLYDTTNGTKSRGDLMMTNRGLCN